MQFQNSEHFLTSTNTYHTMKRNLLNVIPLLLFAVIITGCTKYFNPEPKFEEYEQDSEKILKRKILLISVDGLVGKELEKKIPNNLSQLMKTGKYSFDALTDNNTSDPASWVTMMTGYNSDTHHITDESYLPQPDTEHPHDEVTFAPSVIYRLKQVQSSLRSSIVVQDEGIGNILLMDSDENIVVNSDEKVKEEALKVFNRDNVSDLVILQFKDVLKAGSTAGFDADKSEYAQAIEKVDSQIGEIINKINTREDKEYEDWLIIVTSSHGGVEKSYGGNSFPERNIFTLYSYKHFLPQELKAETMQYVFLNGYFPGTYTHYDGIATRTFSEIGVRAQSPAGDASNVFNANSTPTGAITYDFKFRLREDNVWAGLSFTGGFTFWYNYFLGKDAAANNVNKGWHLYGQNANFKLRFQDGTNTREVEFTRGADGSWHHYSFIFEKLTNTTTSVKVYLDGVLLASQTIEMGVDAFANAEPLTLGFNTQATNLGYTHMDMADFRVWNRALTDAEARNIACRNEIESTDPLAGSLIAHYRELSANTWYNSLENNTPDLTFSNTASVNISGNYMPCDQPIDEVFVQNLDIVPQIFYWFGLKPHETWGFQGEVFLSKFELEFLK